MKNIVRKEAIAGIKEGYRLMESCFGWMPELNRLRIVFKGHLLLLYDKAA
jgi:hypothetical protein